MIERIKKIFLTEEFDKQMADVENKISLFGPEYEEIQARVKAELALEDYSVAPLPPYDHDGLCPKCRFMPGTTQFHAGWHSEKWDACPIPESPHHYPGLTWPFTSSFVSREAAEKQIRFDTWFQLRQEAIPEHFDRECPNCKHRWAESLPAE